MDGNRLQGRDPYEARIPERNSANENFVPEYEGRHQKNVCQRTTAVRVQRKAPNGYRRHASLIWRFSSSSSCNSRASRRQTECVGAGIHQGALSARANTQAPICRALLQKYRL
jgi:hypothetical protein